MDMVFFFFCVLGEVGKGGLIVWLFGSIGDGESEREGRKGNSEV